MKNQGTLPPPPPFQLFQTFPFPSGPSRQRSLKKATCCSSLQDAVTAAAPTSPGESGRRLDSSGRIFAETEVLGGGPGWGGVSIDPPSPRLRAPPGLCRKRSPNRPFTLFSSSAQVQCDSYSARELAGAAAAAAAASASARNAPRPRYIPGKVRAGAELHRDFLLVVHPERAPEKAAREQPKPTRRWEHK